MESGRQAYIGLGFQQRSDAFDFNAALQDHAKPTEAIDYGPSEDMSLKVGETIRIKVPSVGGTAPAPAPAAAGGGFKLGGLAPPTSAGRSKYVGGAPAPAVGLAPPTARMAGLSVSSAPAPAPAPAPASADNNLLGLW